MQVVVDLQHVVRDLQAVVCTGSKDRLYFFVPGLLYTQIVQVLLGLPTDWGRLYWTSGRMYCPYMQVVLDLPAGCIGPMYSPYGRFYGF
jgi:hypothetical protein